MIRQSTTTPMLRRLWAGPGVSCRAPALMGVVRPEEHPRSRSDLVRAVIRPSGCFMGPGRPFCYTRFEDHGYEHAATTRRPHHRALHSPADSAPRGAAPADRARLARRAHSALRARRSRPEPLALGNVVRAG